MTTPAPVPGPPNRPRSLPLALRILAGVSVGLGGLIVLLVYLVRPPARSNARPITSENLLGQSSQEATENLPIINAPPRIARDFSLSNTVSTALGEELEDDGILHLSKEADGRTSLTNLEGVACRVLNRKPRSAGYVYFSIDPGFKRNELKAARIEVEYRVPGPCFMRLQYDAMELERHRPYKTALCVGEPSVNLGTGLGFVPRRPSTGWQTATFLATNGFFMNSQNGGADFRLEVTPPEIFLRRITVTREPVPP